VSAERSTTPPQAAATRLTRAWHAVVGWLPSGLGLLILALLCLRGLRPGIFEDRRLTTEMLRLEQELSLLEAQTEELRQRLWAHSDPIYLERERRALALARPPALTPPPSPHPQSRAGLPPGALDATAAGAHTRHASDAPAGTARVR